MSIKVMYYWTEDGEGELCTLDKIITEKTACCEHCYEQIAANSPAAKLCAVGGEYILHRDCVLESCDIHPEEQGMYQRLERFLSGRGKYQWYAKGVWIGDGHNWNLGMDIPRQPRIPTGETITLKPPKFAFEEVPALECKIYKLRDCEVYIAIGEHKGVPVLFYDMISYGAEYQRRYPDRELIWDCD